MAQDALQPSPVTPNLQSWGVGLLTDVAVTRLETNLVLNPWRRLRAHSLQFPAGVLGLADDMRF